jgi:hypothetical protein
MVKCKKVNVEKKNDTKKILAAGCINDVQNIKNFISTQYEFHEVRKTDMYRMTV